MKKKDFELIEKYMLQCMSDSAHDREHVYRVLFTALEIAEYENNVDYDVLIAACLLHDIGRREQFENPKLCHAQVGAKKAYDFCIENGFSDNFAKKVSSCIITHRFRSNNPPETIEEKILFDADKIDATGALGIARTIFYKGKVGEPLYSVNKDGTVSDGSEDTESSFFHEYKYKLEKLYSKFYTEKGKEIALHRQNSAVSFYENILKEATHLRSKGAVILAEKTQTNPE